MLLINLIAARRAERRKLELIRGILARCMFGVGLLTVLGLAFMTLSIQTTRGRIDDVDKQMGMLQGTVAKVEQLKGSIATVQPRVTTLMTAQNATNRWRAVLQNVSVSLPTQAWITSFASQPDNNGFTITGQAVSQALVGKAMLQLDKQPYIKPVVLHYTQASPNSKVINFEMAGTLEPQEGATNGHN